MAYGDKPQFDDCATAQGPSCWQEKWFGRAARDARCLDILAAAFAETGDFSKAVETEKEALGLATTNGQESPAAAMRQRLSLYNRQTPHRDTPAAAPAVPDTSTPAPPKDRPQAPATK